MRFFLFICISLFSFQLVQAQSSQYEIKKVRLVEEKLSVDELLKIQLDHKNEIEEYKKNNQIRKLDINSISLDQIVNAGLKIWKVIVDNAPVVNLSSQRANALPQGVQTWLEIEGWSELQARKFTITYTNGFNMDVIKLSYILTYTYGGNVRGKGKYLSQVGFMVSNLEVSWGYNFNSVAEVVRVENVGTAQSPMAAVEMNLSWTAKTPIKYVQNAVSFYIKGNGELTARGL